VWQDAPTVLLIAYRFPPQGGAGAQRIVKFVKYLPQFGWRPVVHTVANPYWVLRDETLLTEVPPEVKVYRTPTLELERFAEAAATRLGEPGTEASRPGEDNTRVPPRRKGNPARRPLRAAWKFVFRRVLIPDPQIVWSPVALARSLALIRKERVSLVFTTSPPNSSHVLGLLLKRAAKLPWIAEFRDPWTEGVRRKQAYVGNARRQRMEERLERAVLAGADHLVVTTERTVEQFVRKYADIRAEKYSIITNGFDPSDFSLSPSDGRLLDPERFNLTSAGTIEALFDALPFLSAVRELMDEDEGFRGRLRVNLVGAKRGKYDAFISQNNLAETVRYIPYVPHATCLRYLAESDALFLCQVPVQESAGTKLQAKLFEYLFMRKPILALTLPGETSEVAGRSGLGVTVDPTDRVGIKKAVRDLYLQWREGRRQAPADEAYIGGFDRVKQAERLAAIFREAMEGRG
jgi:glycosyltransferase involved in cell wall biosynthesis